jgi:EAL domain-containing protein (putative c-di-GMP-specific phosphodiesterase class I)
MELFAQARLEGCCGRLGRLVRSIATPLVEGVPLFVNLDPVELEERWLVQPDDPIFHHDTDVYVELTESVPMARFDLCKRVLADLRSRSNVRLVVDDLGAGYSNLKYIADLEPAIVKLDRQLIVGARVGSRQEKLVEGIVRMCNDLEAQVVAEGIETEQELAVARNAGVQFVQGYLFARPALPLPLRDRVETPAGNRHSSSF